MHVKIKRNVRHKSEHSTNIKLSCHPWVFVPSRIPIWLTRLLTLCLLTVMIWCRWQYYCGIFWKILPLDQPNPTNALAGIRRDLHIHPKSLPILSQKSATICRRKQRLLQKSATVAEFGDCLRCLAVFCDSRTFLRQCGQGLLLCRWSGAS